MKRIAALLLFLLASGCVGPGGVQDNAGGTNLTTSGDLWYITLGGPNTDKAWAVTTDPAGNVYLADYETVPGPWADIYVYKFDANGTQQWKSGWGGPWTDQSYVIAEDQGRVYVGGTSFRGALHDTSDAAIIAFDGNGSKLWDFTWDQAGGYEEVDGLVVDGDYIYASGWTKSNSSEDLFIMKLARDGRLEWVKAWGSSGWDEANGQMVVDGNKIYVAGRYDAENMLSGGDALLAAFNKTDGSPLWHRTRGGNGLDDALGMASDGTYLYVVGLTIAPPNGGQIFLTKYDKDGNELWSRNWGGRGSEASRVVLADNDSLYVAGKTDSYGNGANDIALLKYDKDGSLLWYKTWGGRHVDETHGGALYGDYIYIAGETDSFGKGKQDALLIKAGKDGTFPNAD